MPPIQLEVRRVRRNAAVIVLVLAVVVGGFMNVIAGRVSASATDDGSSHRASHPPLPPVLQSPQDGARHLLNPVVLMWCYPVCSYTEDYTVDVDYYELRVATYWKDPNGYGINTNNPNFTADVCDIFVNDTSYTLVLNYSTRYYWAVRAFGKEGPGDWSAFYIFTMNYYPNTTINTSYLHDIRDVNRVHLKGDAWDKDDEEILAYNWTSSIDGFLGNSTELWVYLTPGNHTITFSAMDCHGFWCREPAVVNITVDKNDPPEAPGHIWINDPHDLTPELSWPDWIDPENDSVEYHLNVGTEPGKWDVVYDRVLEGNSTLLQGLDFGENHTGRTYYVGLYAVDEYGAASTMMLYNFTLINHAPEVTITSPLNDTIFIDRNAIYFNATVFDPEGEGPLTFIWSSNLSGELSDSWLSFSSRLPSGYHNITLTVSDPYGATTTASVHIIVSPDTDGDGVADILDNDDDGDGISDDWEITYGLDPLDANDATEDNDGDGLSNLEEYRNGTMPNIKDSDDDGMDDGWEVTYGLCPLDNTDASSDSDGDGLSNLEEYNSGTSPLCNDTDGDGISDGWEITYGLNPLDSNDGSEDNDGDGLSNLQEFRNGTVPNIKDSDGDGMDDGWEVLYGLDPRIKDAADDYDNDGVSNIDEYRHGTNPTFPQKETSGREGEGNYAYPALAILGLVIIVAVIVAITRRLVR